jgi:hypothetical protein
MPIRRTRRVVHRRSAGMGRRRRFHGRGFKEWIGKAGNWIKNNANKIGRTAMTVYKSPIFRGAVTSLAPSAGQIFTKGDQVLKAVGQGRRRIRIPIRTKNGRRRGRGLEP